MSHKTPLASRPHLRPTRREVLARARRRHVKNKWCTLLPRLAVRCRARESGVRSILFLMYPFAGPNVATRLEMRRAERLEPFGPFLRNFGIGSRKLSQPTES